MKNNFEKVILSYEEIDNICKRLGKKISNDFKGKTPILIGILKGCHPFMSDLLKYIDLFCTIEYVQASSFKGGTKSTGNTELIFDITFDVFDKDIILIDDIIDSGRTLKYVSSFLEQKGAKSINYCCLLEKPSKKEVDIDVKYIGHTIGDDFVVGYGFDYKEFYRNVNFIGSLKKEHL